MSRDELAEVSADLEDFLADHWPEASTDQSDSPLLSCSCGWESGQRVDWVTHLMDALAKDVK